LLLLLLFLIKCPEIRGGEKRERKDECRVE
jgi:hypothetical protein